MDEQATGESRVVTEVLYDKDDVALKVTHESLADFAKKLAPHLEKLLCIAKPA